MTPEEYNQKQIRLGKLGDSHLVELARYWQENHQLTVDGYIGPETLSSIEEVAAARIVSQGAPAGGWKPWDGPLNFQPRNRREIYRMFGNPGAVGPDREWERENLVLLQGDSALPGIPREYYIRLHHGVEPYAREGLRRAQLSSPGYKIEKAWGYIWRHIRHDRNRPLSTHSFGVALDIDSHRNYTQYFKRGQGPKAWSDEWMEIWPNGVTREFVEAMASCGWAWGADWDEDGDSTDHTFYDPMHFEWVARDGNPYQV